MSSTRRKKTTRRLNSRRSSNPLKFETLEPRQMLAFSSLFDGTMLTLNQTTDDGIVIIDNNGAGNAFRVTDLSGSDTFVAAQNIFVNLLDSNNSLLFNLDQAHAGDVTIYASTGDRGITFAGTSNSLGGNLLISTGSGQQGLGLAQVGKLAVGGNIDIDLGIGNDSLLLLNDLTAVGNVTFSSINQINANAAAINVGGDLVIDNSDENVASNFQKNNILLSTIGGGLSYLGNSNTDVLNLDWMILAGNIHVSLGDGFTGGITSQELSLSNFAMSNLSVTSGDTTVSDNVSLNATQLYGNLALNLGGGVNSSILSAEIDGNSISYVGGAGVDFVSYDMTGILGAKQNLSFNLGGDNDTFALLDGSTINNFHVDFGAGQDDFINSYGTFTFDAQLDSLRRFSHVYDVATNSLTSNEIVNTAIGDINVVIDPVTGWVVADGGPITFAAGLSINLLDGSGWGLNLQNEDGLNGNLNIDLGDGNRVLQFTGNTNEISGDLTIAGGTGSQAIWLDLLDALVVAGHLGINLGAQGDQIAPIQNGVEADSMTLVGVNQLVNHGIVAVANDVVFDVSGEAESSFFNDYGQLLVFGNMSYFGGNGRDAILFDSSGGSGVAGGFFANLGDNLAATSQSVIVNADTGIFGPVTVLSTNSLGSDVFRSMPTTTLAGNIFVGLGGGTNVGNFGHENLANSIAYLGGAGVDAVYLQTTGVTPANFNIVLGAGDDELALEASTNIGDLLRVDFGGGDDLFTNNKGNFTWETRLLNLYGFSSFYYPASDFLNIVQVTDLGDVALDNNGPAGLISLDSAGGSYEITPAFSLRLNMLPGSNSDVAIDLGTSLGGNLILDLKAGDRNVYLVGSSNEVTGDLRIDAGTGIQEIHLGVNSELNIAGNAVINLREGADSIFDGGHPINVTQSLFLRNVNQYEVTNQLSVGQNLIFATLWETEDSRLDSDSQIQIGGYFYYLGGDGEDVVLLSDTAVAGHTFINVGMGTTPGSVQLVELTSNSSIGGNLIIRGGTASGGIHVTLAPTTVVGGNMGVNFLGSSTANTAALHGTYLGDYGTYRGGSAKDVVSFGATATDMFFSSLLFNGDDEFTLDSTAEVLFKYLDFGLGLDLFDDNHLAIFPIATVNLP